MVVDEDEGVVGSYYVRADKWTRSEGVLFFFFFFLPSSSPSASSSASGSSLSGGVKSTQDTHQRASETEWPQRVSPGPLSVFPWGLLAIYRGLYSA